MGLDSARDPAPARGLEIFRLMGTQTRVGSKAGGPDYLLQFLEPRVITEDTMRRGFSPEILP